MAAAFVAMRSRQANLFSVGPILDVGDNAKLMLSEIPSSDSVLGDYEISVCFNSKWQQRRMIFTKKAIYFLSLDGKRVKDVILMHEVLKVEGHGERENSENPADANRQRVVVLETLKEGYNFGRIYNWKFKDCSHVQQIRTLSEKAKIRRRNKNFFRASQTSVSKVFNSNTCQTITAILIFVNFICNIMEAQLQDLLTNAEGSNTSVGDAFDNINLVFTILFAVELSVNLYAHWFRDFVNNRWNIVDSALVLWSLVTIGDTQITVFRLVRVFRVVRIFGKFRSLRKIVNAISASVGPMVGAFVILMTLMCLYAILGVSLYGTSTPNKFGAFDRAFVTMFQLTAGDTWVETVELLGEDGYLNWSFAAFVLSYIMLSCWILLQVTTAVLLDSFCKASNDIEMEENLKKRPVELYPVDPLEPLLLGLSVEYRDSDDLSHRLQNLFKEFDTDHSERLTFDELSAALRQMRFNPPLHFSEDDFDALTLNKTLCDAQDSLDAHGFEVAMRQRLQRYVMNRLGRAEAQSDHELAMSQVFALKDVMMSLRRIEEPSNANLSSSQVWGRGGIGNFPGNGQPPAPIGVHGPVPAEPCPEPRVHTVCDGGGGGAAESRGQGGGARDSGDKSGGSHAAAPVVSPVWPSSTGVGNKNPVVVTSQPNPAVLNDATPALVTMEPALAPALATVPVPALATMEPALALVAMEPAPALAWSARDSPVVVALQADAGAAFNGLENNCIYQPWAVDAALPYLVCPAASAPTNVTSAAAAANAPIFESGMAKQPEVEGCCSLPRLHRSTPRPRQLLGPALSGAEPLVTHNVETPFPAVVAAEICSSFVMTDSGHRSRYACGVSRSLDGVSGQNCWRAGETLPAAALYEAAGVLTAHHADAEGQPTAVNWNPHLFVAAEPGGDGSVWLAGHGLLSKDGNECRTRHWG